MTGSVISGFFLTGPEDDLKVADLQSVKTDGTSSESLLGGAGAGESSLLAQFAKNETVRDVASLLDTVMMLGSEGGGQGCIKPVNAERVSNAVGGSVNLNKLCGKTATNLLDSIAALDLNEIDSVLDVFGNTIEVKRGVEATELQRITDLTKQFTLDTGIAEIKDLAGRMGVRNTLIGEAIDLGAFDLLDSLFNDPTEVDRDQALNSVGNAITNGDHKTVAKMATLLGRDAILYRYPDVVTEVLRSYRFPLRTTTADYDRLATELKTSLATIDPDWYRFQRNGEWISEITCFRYASDAATRLLTNDDEFKTPMMIAKSYVKKDIGDIAVSNFPYLTA